MRLPRGIQTGDVPRGQVVIGSEAQSQAALAREISNFSEQIANDAARAEFGDAISAVEASTRNFVERSRDIRFNEDTQRPSFETAEQDFDEFFGNLEQEAMGKLSSNKAKNELQTQMRHMRDSALVQVRNTARDQQIDHIQARTTSTIERFVSLGEFDAARLAIEDQRPFFSAGEFENLSTLIDSREESAAHAAKVEQVVNEALRTRQAEGPEAAAAFLRDLKDTEDLPEGFTRETVDDSVARGIQELRKSDELDRRANANLESELRVERAIAIDGFRRGIDSVTSDEDIDLFVRDHAITDHGLIGSFYSARDKHRDSLSILETEYIDPTDSNVRDLVDLRIQQMQPPDPIGAAIAIAADTGIASRDLERFFEGGARSPEQFAEAAARYRMFRESAPQAYLPLSDDAKAMYSLSATLGRAGMNPLLAAETAFDTIFNSTPEQRQDRRNNYPGEDIVGSVIDDLNDIPGMHKPGIFIDSVADVPSEMLGDMNRIGLAVYERTGDLESSREAVAKNIVNAWQYTDVNEGVQSGDDELGPVYMKGAPRRGTDFIRKRLEEFFDNDGRLYIQNGEFKTIDHERVEIWSPPIPEANEFRQPVWILRVDGMPLLDEMGNVVRWTYEVPPGTERPLRPEVTVTEAGFISLPPGASGVIERD